MRIAYLDCSMGISGDMTLGALIDAGVSVDALRQGIASLNLPAVELQTREVMKCGFRAIAMYVQHPEQHAHRHLSDIHKLIDEADAITPAQKTLARSIFHAVATAEAKVHGSTLDKVHFHEVGAIDSIVDIIGAAIGFDLLGAEQIVCSPLPTGRGQVHIDHGICTVPTPGTAEILKGIPLKDVPVEAELTTPTGAAIVATLVNRFGSLPEMTIESVGYGAGTMDVPNRANLLRLFVGTPQSSPETDRVCVLETNIDDVSAEVVGYTKQKLMQAGALDVFSTPVQMKKDRPGVMLSVIASPADVQSLEEMLFAETQTFGIRHHWVERSKRTRDQHTVDTPFGPVLGKLGWRTGSAAVFAPEFESCAKLAAEHGVTLREIYRAAETAFTMNTPPEQPSRPHTHDHDSHSHDHDHDHDHDSHSHDRDGHTHDHDH